MSFIIKGMKLPQNGEMKNLTIGRAPNGSEPIAIVHGDTTEFYKVVEIPTPHGRLIDADDLDSITVISYPSKGDPFVAGRLKKIIAPTIIEAEVSN